MKKEEVLENTLLVFSKEVNDNGRKFVAYYGYRQTVLPDGSFTDVITPSTDSEGKAVMLRKSIKIRFRKDFIESRKDLVFPAYITLSNEVKVEDGKDSFYVTIDKDANKVARLDKNGNKHLVLVIRDIKSFIPAPKKSYSLDDLDDF